MLCLCNCHRGVGNVPPDMKDAVAAVFACIMCAHWHEGAMREPGRRLFLPPTWQADGGYDPTGDTE